MLPMNIKGEGEKVRIVKKIWIIALSVLIFITGCTSKKDEKGFFAWMDGYLAMAVGEDYSIALTFFFEQNNAPFDTGEITDLSFDNLEQIEILRYSINPLEADEALRYGGYSFNLDIRADGKGVFKTDKLIATIDNSSVIFTIGEWVFDIEEATLPLDAEGVIDIWGSPVVGSNSRTFAYDYTITDNKTKIKEIWISEDIILSETEGLPLSNVIELPQTINAPINFIRPKIVLDIDGEEFITFGMSYYSGAMGVQEDVLEKSKERNMR